MTPCIVDEAVTVRAYPTKTRGAPRSFQRNRIGSRWSRMFPAGSSDAWNAVTCASSPDWSCRRSHSISRRCKKATSLLETTLISGRRRRTSGASARSWVDIRRRGSAPRPRDPTRSGVGPGGGEQVGPGRCPALVVAMGARRKPESLARDYGVQSAARWPYA
jgi:hypothetical protein